LYLTAQGQVLPSDSARRADFAGACDSALLGGPRLLHWPGASAPCNATLSRLHTPQGTPAVLMLALSLPPGRGPEVLAYAALHGLSEAETRVLERLARGESTTLAAQALHVAPATVRSQAASLRRKTGHPSVAELLRTLAALPPLATDGE
jgi:DNA-binding CsgD family transcriptional regulator